MGKGSWVNLEVHFSEKPVMTYIAMNMQQQFVLLPDGSDDGDDGADDDRCDRDGGAYQSRLPSSSSSWAATLSSSSS